MKLDTDDGRFTGEDRWIAIHIDDKVRSQVERGAKMVNIVFPVNARYEYEGRKSTEIREDNAVARLNEQDIKNIRQMPEGYNIYSIFPEERDNGEIHELNEDFKEEING